MITTVTSSGLETSYRRLRGDRDAGNFDAFVFDEEGGGGAVLAEEVEVGAGGRGDESERVRSCNRGVGVAAARKKI